MPSQQPLEQTELRSRKRAASDKHSPECQYVLARLVFLLPGGKGGREAVLPAVLPN
jgi:hypothetical protein